MVLIFINNLKGINKYLKNYNYLPSTTFLWLKKESGNVFVTFCENNSKKKNHLFDCKILF